MQLDFVSGTCRGSRAMDDYLVLADGSERKGWPEDVPLEDSDADAPATSV